MRCEILQGAHFGLLAVEALKGRTELSGDIADELGLEGVVLIGATDGLLLIAGEVDEAQQKHNADQECGGEDNGERAEGNMAIWLSVTVSIAAVTKGTFSPMLREKRVFNSTVLGSTSE